MDKDKAPYLEMSPGKEAGIKYPQKFVQAANPNKPGPNNSAAMRAPSASEVFNEVMHAKK